MMRQNLYRIRRDSNEKSMTNTDVIFLIITKFEGNTKKIKLDKIWLKIIKLLIKHKVSNVTNKRQANTANV